MPEVNSQKEDYLITIFKLMGEGEKVTNKSISEQLDLAPSSVTEMLKKLKDQGLVKNSKENILTDSGLALTKKILSKHRLWEYFLEKELEFSWKDVHPIANNLQSVTDDELLDKLNAYLGYPDYCPHGSVIFINNESSSKDLIKMNQANPDKEYIISRIRDKRDLLEYCESIDIKIGDKIKLIAYDNFDNTVIVKTKNKEIRISPKASKDIYLLDEK
ncbi:MULTISPECIES: metal-dependent transcriptional regulator [Anaerococcus]|mgnify:FL=1|uniref:metal-dependent transcriptional regulator n=1 Tax=Anaerococcus TaxID=165779 RepID=UPI001AE41613|nr:MULTISPECIES: metal-dependent transcriptional regulator [Anaerococcus]MBP2069072.1 DtxR family Mn-dependent transcriptional regulator [Anaerococcus nagyae]MDU1828122.1 metal-dependent transcriptional regulator [Anaerococcus sp.]MDU1864327.1 metal-dependent transcriptional regulator [Anaerococcus sp.]